MALFNVILCHSICRFEDIAQSHFQAKWGNSKKVSSLKISIFWPPSPLARPCWFYMYDAFTAISFPVSFFSQFLQIFVSSCLLSNAAFTAIFAMFSNLVYWGVILYIKWCFILLSSLHHVSLRHITSNSRNSNLTIVSSSLSIRSFDWDCLCSSVTQKKLYIWIFQILLLLFQ